MQNVANLVLCCRQATLLGGEILRIFSFLVSHQYGMAAVFGQYFLSLDNGSQTSLNRSPQSLHTSLVCGLALKAAF